MDALLRLDFGDQDVDAGGDELLFADGESRDLPWLCCAVDAPGETAFSLSAEVAPVDTGPAPVLLPGLWSELRAGLRLAGTARDENVVTLDAILPWFAHDALIHYLSPRGLEQYTGGAWGTRDVCQGPVGLLTAHARDDALRDVLLRVFRDQNARGDWPQAFDYLPSRRRDRAGGRPRRRRLLAPARPWRLPADHGRHRAAGRGAVQPRRRRPDAPDADRRARAPGRRAHRVDPRRLHSATGVRPRRLERLAAAGRPAAGLADGVHLDGHPAVARRSAGWPRALLPPAPSPSSPRAAPTSLPPPGHPSATC